MIELVKSQVQVLKLQVQCTIRDLARVKIDEELPDAIARGIFDEYLAKTLLGRDVGDREVYSALNTTYWLQSHDKLLRMLKNDWILKSVEIVATGLEQASNAMDHLREDARNDLRREFLDVEDAFKENISVNNVEAALEDIVKKAKQILKPLFENDCDVGYFTCTQFKGPYPWKDQKAEE